MNKYLLYTETKATFEIGNVHLKLLGDTLANMHSI